MSDSGSEGRAFESHRGHKLKGRIPSRCPPLFLTSYLDRSSSPILTSGFHNINRKYRI